MIWFAKKHGCESNYGELRRRWRGSTVEQLTCNQQVVGSIPIASSIVLLRISRRKAANS